MSDIIQQATQQYQKRAFIYVRVSTDKQAEEGYSIPQQIERLKKYCEAMNWQVAKIYTDDGYSGGDLERPAVKQMEKDISKGLADIVLVDKLDRLSRSQFDTLYMIQKVFDPHHVGFVSRAEAFDTSTPFGKAMVGILAVFAELERTRIKERMADGKEGRAKDGLYHGGGMEPIGYNYDKTTKTLSVNEYEAMQVREIFKLFNERMPLNTIANYMNDKGYRHKHGEWYGNTIRALLQNPLYTGKIRHFDDIYDGQHDAIIDEKTFDDAQELFKRRKIDNAKYVPGRKYTSPFGGLIWCAHCGAKYHWRLNGKNQDGSRRAYYMCYSRSKADKNMVRDPNCKNKNYRDKDLEKLLYDEILKLKSEPIYYSDIQTSVDTAENQHLIEERMKEIESQTSKLMDLYSLSGINMEQLRKKIEPLNTELGLLAAELESLKEQKEVLPKTKVIEFVDIFSEELRDGTPQSIHAMLEVLIESIVIDGEDIHVRWNF